MKSIGVVICNYNKEDYILNCIDSLLKQTIHDFDVYVVDNSSTDRSVELVQERFGDKVNLLVNKENLGGSGGFNTGIREVLKGDYEYLVCLDNDIILDKQAIEMLRNFLETHPEVGMVGSRAYFMDNPDRIWSFSADIDFDKYVQRDNYRNYKDGDEVPEVVYCTYVPACSLMARVDAVRKVGIMPEENFIYWDDMEWGYRFNEAGYKVAAYAKSKVWHKGGGRNATNTFNNYYLWRNRIRFFLKVLQGEQLEKFADVILDELFGLLYSCNLKREIGIVKSVSFAFQDAVQGKSGKAEDYKILPRSRDASRVTKALEGAKSVIILFNGDYEGLGNIIRTITQSYPEIKIGIALAEDCQVSVKNVQNQFSEYTIEDSFCTENYDTHLIMCEHIFKIEEDMQEDRYIDSWCNIIYTPEDYVYAKSYRATKELFVLCKKDILLNAKLVV